MRIDFNITQTELSRFRTACDVVLRNVAYGTKAAAESAGYYIVSESLAEVPKDTGTLASSIFLGVSRRADIKNYKYGAIVGYGKPSGLGYSLGLTDVQWVIQPTNRINPKSGAEASTYAAIVHEDLGMMHPHGGKAKFLEDPVRNFAANHFARTAMTYWKQAIRWSTVSDVFKPAEIQMQGWDPSMPVYFKQAKSGKTGLITSLRPGKGYRRMIHGYKFETHKTGTQRGGSRVYKGESE